jgi:hypothetical protein
MPQNEWSSVSLPENLVDELDSICELDGFSSRTDVVRKLLDVVDVASLEDSQADKVGFDVVTSVKKSDFAVFCPVCESLLGEYAFDDHTEWFGPAFVNQFRVACMTCSLESGDPVFRYGEELVAISAGEKYDSELARLVLQKRWDELIQRLEGAQEETVYPQVERMLRIARLNRYRWLPNLSGWGEYEKEEQVIDGILDYISAVFGLETEYRPECSCSSHRHFHVSGKDDSLESLKGLMADRDGMEVEYSGGGVGIVLLGEN